MAAGRNERRCRRAEHVGDSRDVDSVAAGIVTGEPASHFEVGNDPIGVSKIGVASACDARSQSQLRLMGAIDVRHRWSRCEPGCQECRDPSSAFFL